MTDHTCHPARFRVRTRIPTEYGLGTMTEISGMTCHGCGRRGNLSQRGIPEELTQHDPATGQTFTVRGYRGTSLDDRRDLAVEQDPEGDVAKARLAELAPPAPEPVDDARERRRALRQKAAAVRSWRGYAQAVRAEHERRAREGTAEAYNAEALIQAHGLALGISIKEQQKL